MLDVLYLPVPPLFWPLSFLLVALLALRRLREDVRPIFRGMAGGLAQHSARHSLAYAMALLYAMAASLQAMAEVFTQLGWVYAAAAAKVLQPGVVAVIAYVTKGPNLSPPPEPKPDLPANKTVSAQLPDPRSQTPNSLP